MQFSNIIMGFSRNLCILKLESNIFLLLFQVKLFREWNTKWPEEHKLSLKEQVTEIDAPFGEKLKEEILNGFSGENGTSTPVESQPPVIIQSEAVLA